LVFGRQASLVFPKHLAGEQDTPPQADLDKAS
jgi:hypothetical protein